MLPQFGGPWREAKAIGSFGIGTGVPFVIYAIGTGRVSGRDFFSWYLVTSALLGAIRIRRRVFGVQPQFRPSWAFAVGGVVNWLIFGVAVQLVNFQVLYMKFGDVGGLTVFLINCIAIEFAMATVLAPGVPRTRMSR